MPVKITERHAMNDAVKNLDAPSFESFLVQCQILSPDLLSVVRREKGKERRSFEKILLNLHLINEEQLTELLSDFSGLPLADLSHHRTISAVVHRVIFSPHLAAF